MPPQGLHQGLLEVLQLVGHAAWPTGVLDRGLRRDRGTLRQCVRQRRALKVLVQQGRLANAFARAAVLFHPAGGQPDQGAGAEKTDRAEDEGGKYSLYLLYIKRRTTGLFICGITKTHNVHTL